MKVYKFHQFIKLEKGLINTLIINFLDSNIYHVENSIIDRWKQKNNIKGIEQFFIENKLVIKVDKETWIPDYMDVLRVKPWYSKFHRREITFEDFFNFPDQDIEYIDKMELEEGVDISLINNEFADIDVGCIKFYGEKKPVNINVSDNIDLLKSDFNKCVEMATIVEGKFEVNKNFYLHNLKYNTCWQNKIAITKDGLVRPCIYSDIVLGDLNKDSTDKILEKLKDMWELTKDKVKKCKDCEFRYLCIDCRVIAQKVNNDLYDENPNCGYDPYVGKWAED